jgi:hypothetical protein
MKTTKINRAEKFGRFADHWSPKIVATLNGQEVKVVKFQGEFCLASPVEHPAWI